MKLTLQRSFGYPIPNLKLGETAEEDHFRKDRPHNVIFSTRISHKKTYRETVSFLNVSPFDTLLFFLLFSTISNHTGRVHRRGDAGRALPGTGVPDEQSADAGFARSSIR